jgi:hypothetical protein
MYQTGDQVEWNKPDSQRQASHIFSHIVEFRKNMTKKTIRDGGKRETREGNKRWIWSKYITGMFENVIMKHLLVVELIYAKILFKKTWGANAYCEF